MEREKHLILEGKMAVEEAPEELANHPVFKITQMTNKILDEKRQKVLYFLINHQFLNSKGDL